MRNKLVPDLLPTHKHIFKYSSLRIYKLQTKHSPDRRSRMLSITEPSLHKAATSILFTTLSTARYVPGILPTKNLRNLLAPAKALTTIFGIHKPNSNFVFRCGQLHFRPVSFLCPSFRRRFIYIYIMENWNRRRNQHQARKDNRNES